MSNTRIDEWPQRPNFRRWADQWLAARQEKSMAERRDALAAALDMASRDVLKQYYSGKQVPGQALRQRMILVLGCPSSDIMDDPNTAPLGISPAGWAGATEQDRVIASAMFNDLLSLPDDQKALYYELWQKGVEIAKARIAAERERPK